MEAQYFALYQLKQPHSHKKQETLNPDNGLVETLLNISQMVT